jgi:hypothetical protein
MVEVGAGAGAGATLGDVLGLGLNIEGFILGLPSFRFNFHNTSTLFLGELLSYGRWYAHLLCKLWVISHRLHKSFLLG